MREQRGYIFQQEKSWFVRDYDDVMQPDGVIRRQQVCKKLTVAYGGDYRTEKSVQPFVAEILAPLNRKNWEYATIMQQNQRAGFSGSAKHLL
jgi:hypothetical protein